MLRIRWLANGTVARCVAAISARLGGFKSNTNGNVAVIFAALLPFVVGGIGLGVETSYWYYSHLKLQSAADASAISGALQALTGASLANVDSAAEATATDNGFISAAGTITVNDPPTSGSHMTDTAVEVVLTQKIDRLFTSIFSNQPIEESARAVAVYATDSSACLLALDPSASSSLYFSGNANLSVTGCAVMTNSVSDTALRIGGTAKLDTNCLVSVGGVSIGGSLTMSDCKEAVTYAPPAQDPFADLSPPPITTPCQDDKPSTLLPGTYCSGLSIKGAVTLEPGTYVITGGDLKINASAALQGDGVTIYLAPDASVSINGNAYVNLSAPTSGTYSGILFFGDRASTAGTATFNGTADSQLTGALYFSNQEVKYNGNFTGLSGCTQVVAKTIDWGGTGNIKQDCASLGMKTIPGRKTVSLVE